MTLSIPGYKIGEQVGEGGMASVYRAKHIRLDRDVALKVMLHHYAKDTSFSERFTREARIAASLNHPNIVQIYDVNRYKETLFLAMEYVKHGDLAEHMQSPRDLSQVATIIHALCDALHYAHEQGYIHRDIKPANILFRENGSLALSDFGIARAIHSNANMTQSGVVIGTPSYMSPEQAQSQQLSHQSDLYSVAVIAYQLVMGKLPYVADSAISVAVKHINEPIPTLPESMQALQPFFNKALSKTANERYDSGKALALAFSQAILAIDPKTHIYPNHATTLLNIKNDAKLPLFDTDEHDMEAETLANISHNKHVGKHTPSFDKPEKPTTLVGEIMAASQATMKMIFMQINRVLVLMQAPDKKLRYATLFVILMTLGTVLYTVHKIINDDKYNLSPGQEIRIGQLLTGADSDIVEERLFAPVGNNAYEKYLAILSLSNDDPVAVNGIKHLINLTEEKARSAIDNNQFTDAQKYISQLEQTNTDISLELKALLSTRSQQQQENIAKALINAKKAAQNNNTEEAIRIYQNILALQPENSEEIQTKLRDIAIQKIASAKILSQKTQFFDAKAELIIANKALHQLDDETLQKQTTSIEKEIEKKQSINDFIISMNGLKNQGDAALKNDYIERPANSSAYYYYSRIIESISKRTDLAKNDRQKLLKDAQQGKENVYTKLSILAKNNLQQGNPTKAKEYITRLKALSRHHPDLSTLNRELKITQRTIAAAEASQKKVKDLYRRASIYLAAGRAKSADKVYAQILRLDPDHKDLKNLGKAIADAYVGLAQKEIDAQDWKDVDVWVNMGLKHVPNHEKLLELSSYANQQLSTR